MIFTQNVSFFCIILFVVVYNVSSLLINDRRLSNVLLIVGSALILTSITSLTSIAILLLVSALVYLWGRLVHHYQQYKKLLLTLSIVGLILLFIAKNYEIAHLALLHRIGLSYILFRLIHYLIESGKQTIRDYDFIGFLNYIIFFPTFIAGPIDDYNNFVYWIKQKHNTYKWLLIKAGIFRLSLGIVKKFFLVPIIINYALDFSLFEGQFSWQMGLLLSCFLYSFYILLDFSGYTDIAIGTAYLIGIKTPENFDNPYFAKNLSTFWKKWHMTFSNFLFKYIFKPLVTALSKQFKKSPRLFISSVGYLITFAICGIWHGNTLNFFYWGMWHGIGLILFKLWDKYVYKKKLTHRFWLAVYNTGAVFVTFTFVTFGWFFFNYDTKEINLITGNMTTDNSSEICVSTVVYGESNYFKIAVENNDAPYLEIEYKSALGDSLVHYDSVKTNTNNIYYLNPAEKTKTLCLIRARSSYSATEKGPWYSTLSYLDARTSKQTYFERVLFGSPVAADTLLEKPIDLLDQKFYLPADYLQQTVTSEALYIENYGWAIMIHYKPHDIYRIQVEYKYEEEDWTTYLDDRDGVYDFVHIHGDIFHDETNMNLRPGNYETRIRYLDNEKNGDWFYSTTTVPDYLNENTDN